RGTLRVAGRRIELRARDQDRLESQSALERVVDPGLIENRAATGEVEEVELDPARDRSRRTREVGDVPLLRLEREVEGVVGAGRRARALAGRVLVLVVEPQGDDRLLGVAVAVEGRTSAPHAEVRGQRRTGVEPTGGPTQAQGLTLVAEADIPGSADEEVRLRVAGTAVRAGRRRELELRIPVAGVERTDG